MATQRFESSVTAVSWIPSEAISGPSKIPFELGVTHYDDPPPDRLESLEQLRTSDRFREANELRAFIEVEDGRIVRSGHLGQGHIGATTVRVGARGDAFPAVQLPDIQQEPEVGEASVRFVQTIGGRMGLPTPRPVPHPPFVQFWPSIAWTTLALTINADGSASHELVGASPFPRHWIYDDDGAARREVRRDRLREVVQQLVRRPNAMGHAGLAGGDCRGRVVARALAVGRDHAGRRQAEDPQGRARARTSCGRARRAPRSS